MALSERRITVVVDGSSKELQVAINKAVEGLRRLGTVTAQQSKIAVDWGDRVIRKNNEVAASYTRLVESAGKASLNVARSSERQATAVRNSATVVTSATKAERDAIAGLATTATRASTDISSAAERQAAAVRGASAESVAASRRASVAARDGAARQSAAAIGSSSALVRLGKATTVTAAAVAVGSVYMSSKFEAASERLLTQAGANQAQVEQMRQGILGLAGALGQTPQHLTEGLYHIVSSMNAVLPATTRTSEELKIMAVAAQGAAVGGSNMQETAYALASAMNSLHVRASGASKTMAELNAIVGTGDMTMNDLLAALKSGLIPTAQAFHISLRSVGSALALMGDQGMRGALAGTRLRMSLALLAAPTKQSTKLLTALGMGTGEVKARTEAMSEALAKAGLSTTTLAADLEKPNGIGVALKDLKDHMTKAGLSASESAALISRAFGGGRMGATVQLLAQSVDRLSVKYDQQGHQVKKWGEDWSKTQGTLAFQAKQAEGAVVSLGVRIGKELTPAAKALLSDLKETAGWLEHNEGAAKALAFTITGVLSVAVAAFVANRLAKMVEGLKQIGAMQRYLRGGFGMTAATGASRSAPPGGVGGGILGGNAMGIGGAKTGLGLPGSMSNPIVVAVEAGSFAGLGAQGAAIGAPSTSTAASAAERRTTGGVILPPGPTSRAMDARALAQEQAMTDAALTGAGGQAMKQEEAAVRSSMTGGLRSLAGKMSAGLMRGGMIAGIGVPVAQLAGATIGGSTGKTVSTVGTDAALGAAIGTAISPGIGTAIGGGLGALAAVIKLLDTPTSKDRANRAFHRPGAPNLTGSPEAAQAAAAFQKEEDELEKLLGKPGGRRPRHGFTPRAGGFKARAAPTDAELARRKEVEDYYQQQAGAFLGKSESQYVLHGTKNPGLQSIVNTAKADLEQLKPIGRTAFTGFIRSMVETLEHEQRLPKGALERVIAQLQPLLKGALPFSAGQSAKDFSAQFVANLRTEDMLHKVADVSSAISKNWAREFGILPVTTHMSFTQATATAEHDLDVLKFKMHHGTEAQMKEARTQYEQLAPMLKNYIHAAGVAAHTQLDVLAKQVGTGAGKGVNAFAAAYNALPPELKKALSKSGGEVAAAIDKINKMAAAELKIFGVAGGMVKQLSSSKLLGEGFAKGGLVQLGRPGQKGRDSIPLNVNGAGIIAAPGEQVAVFTHEQQAVANAKMADIGGLPGLFSKHKTPHHMATGGFVPRQAYPGPMGRIDQGVDFAGPGPVRAVLDGSVRRTGIWPGWPGVGGIVYSTGRGNVYVMENFVPMVGAGPVKAGQIIGTDIGGKYGIETGWANAAGTGPLTPYNGAADGTPMPGGKSFASFLGGGPGGGVTAGAAAGAALAAVWKKIATPKVRGAGVPHALAQAIVNRVAAAANKKGEAVAGAGGAGTGAAVGAMVGNAMQLAKAAAAAEHVPWDAGIVRALLQKESSGGQNLPPHNYGGSLDPAGPMQIISSTFSAYEVPGHGNRMTPWDNFLAGFNYIHHRYGTLQNLASTTGLFGRGYKGYEEGGLIPAASGVLASAASSKKVSPTKARAKTKLTKPKTHKPSIKQQAAGSLARKLGPLQFLAGATTIPDSIAPYEKALGSMSNLMGLLKTVEGDKDGPVLLASDMQYLSGLAPYGVRAGMPADAAYAKYEQVLAQKGETPDLSLEGQIIKWTEGQASHRLLTPQQAGILAAAGKDAMDSNELKAGRPVLAIEEGLVAKEISELFSEKQAAGKVVSRVSALIDERRKRAAHMMNLMKVAAKRAANIREDLARLGSANRAAKLHAAQHSYYQNQRVFDATEHKDALNENIAAVEAIPAKDRSAGDKANLAHWKTEEAGLTHFIHSIRVPSAGALTAAHYAVLKGNLQNELTPISTQLSLLGGSSTHVGHGGQWGTMEKDIKTFLPARDAAEGELATITDSKIPTAYLSLEDIGRSMAESELPRKIAGAGAGAGENSALIALQKEQLAIQAQTIALQGAQFATLSSFAQNIPRFKKGGPVLDDGLAYVHRGEHVIPREGTLVSHGGAPQVHLTNEVNVHGDIAPLLALIDARVTHPANVRAVSGQMARRTQNFPGFSR